MLWEEIQKKGESLGWNPHQVFQEEMQKTILTSLSREGVFNDIVFKGGTSLRFFYGNPRFSEDLDFVCRNRKGPIDLSKPLSKTKLFAEYVFPFINQIIIKPQKINSTMQRFILSTISDVHDQKLRIHIEFFSLPSYHNIPRILSYPPMNPAIRVETQEEILADKITALGNRPYIKGRDIWDIHLLIKEKHMQTQFDLVSKKISDYGTKPDDFRQNLQRTKEILKKEGEEILSLEMKRFLPSSLLNQYKDLFYDMVVCVIDEIKTISEVMKK